MDKILSIIIPFLNEGIEVENTVRNILDFSDNDVEIILINDASDDDYDYQLVAEQTNVTYIVNNDRMGVAASRDLGIEISQTPFFLLLDAHMRFYDHNWVKKIVNELTKDDKTLLCCQTRSLVKKNGQLVNLYDTEISYGAYVDLEDKNSILDAKWNYIKDISNVTDNNMLIPCVLGAAYACRKKFWQNLKGLEGLMFYGCDEAFISMKVWLAGGNCKLLLDTVVGHIFRNNESPVPYNNDNKYFLYNKLLIIDTLLPEEIKGRLKYNLKSLYTREIIIQVEYLIYKSKQKRDDLRQYFTTNFDFKNYKLFTKINNRSINSETDRNLHAVLEILSILEKQVDDQLEKGIANGLMGVIIMYYNYANISHNTKYIQKADNLLEMLFTNITPDSYYGFSSGLCGIGWGLSYLCQNNFIDFEVDEIFEYIDKMVMEIDPNRIVNCNFDYGLGGLVTYILSRIHLSRISNKILPFDNDFLLKINNRIRLILDTELAVNETCDSIPSYIDFLDFYEHRKETKPSTLFDLYSIFQNKNTDLKSLTPGLSGLSGLALNLLNCS
ncbi:MULTISPECIES: glycosyltransferase [Sphingobacterium]|uniref:glycosyltransferase n=1 Tax=Sphingobacterium TaxID=28453 RepID=UPI0025809EC4|nr:MULTISPECIES: glycosyltransferase [Sphingobacterium]